MTHGGAYPAGGGYPRDDDDDLRGASEHATRHAGSSGSSDLFSNLLGALTQKKQSLANEDVDEDDAVKQHKRFFERDDDDDEADDRSMGSAAAMQALKMFTGGQTGNTAVRQCPCFRWIVLLDERLTVVYRRVAARARLWDLLWLKLARYV